MEVEMKITESVVNGPDTNDTSIAMDDTNPKPR